MVIDFAAVRRAVALRLIGAVLASLTGAGAGLPAAWAEAGSERRDRAAKHHDDGVAASRAGRHAAAAGHFDAAYELDPHPTLLWNAARAWERAGRSEEARIRYLRYSALDEVGEQLREEALLRHEDLRRMEGAGRVAGGALGVEARSVAASLDLVEVRAEPSSSLPPAGWALVGAGSAAAVSGVVFLMLMADDLAVGRRVSNNELAGDAHDVNTEFFDHVDASMQRHRALGATFLAVGGVALGVGVVLVMLGSRPAEADPDAVTWGLAPLPGGGALSASGRF